MESSRYCFRCGVQFARGGLAYQMHVQMAADFDGYINADLLDASADGALDAVARASERSEEELTEDVYRERILLFCRRCAERVWHEITTPKPRELS